MSAAAIAGCKCDGMLGCSRSDKGVVDGVAGDGQGGQPRVETPGSVDAEKPRVGKLYASSRATAVEVRQRRLSASARSTCRP